MCDPFSVAEEILDWLLKALFCLLNLTPESVSPIVRNSAAFALFMTPFFFFSLPEILTILPLFCLFRVEKWSSQVFDVSCVGRSIDSSKNHQRTRCFCVQIFISVRRWFDRLCGKTTRCRAGGPDQSVLFPLPSLHVWVCVQTMASTGPLRNFVIFPYFFTVFFLISFHFFADLIGLVAVIAVQVFSRPNYLCLPPYESIFLVATALCVSAFPLRPEDFFFFLFPPTFRSRHSGHLSPFDCIVTSFV